EGRDLHVVPHQVAFGETLAGPEDLVEVADLQRVASGQRESGLGLAPSFVLVELVDDKLQVSWDAADAAELKFSPPGVPGALRARRPGLGPRALCFRHPAYCTSRLRAIAPSRLWRV